LTGGGPYTVVKTSVDQWTIDAIWGGVTCRIDNILAVGEVGFRIRKLKNVLRDIKVYHNDITVDDVTGNNIWLARW